MTPILDRREGDIEDDASSTERRSMLWLAGSLLAEISLPKLVVTWMLLIGLPGLLLGAAPLLVSFWIRAIVKNLANAFYELAPILLLALLAAVGWFAGRPLLPADRPKQRRGIGSLWPRQGANRKTKHSMY